MRSFFGGWWGCPLSGTAQRDTEHSVNKVVYTLQANSRSKVVPGNVAAIFHSDMDCRIELL